MTSAVAAWQVSVVAVSFRLRGFQATAAHLLAPPPATLDRRWMLHHSPLEAFERTARLPWSTCLTRAVAAAGRLRKQGYPARLRLGARVSPVFTAHAWITLRGQSWSAGEHQPLTGDRYEDGSPL